MTARLAREQAENVERVHAGKEASRAWRRGSTVRERPVPDVHVFRQRLTCDCSETSALLLGQFVEQARLSRLPVTLERENHGPHVAAELLEYLFLVRPALMCRSRFARKNRSRSSLWVSFPRRLRQLERETGSTDLPDILKTLLPWDRRQRSAAKVSAIHHGRRRRQRRLQFRHQRRVEMLGGKMNRALPLGEPVTSSQRLPWTCRVVAFHRRSSVHRPAASTSTRPVYPGRRSVARVLNDALLSAGLTVRSVSSSAWTRRRGRSKCAPSKSTVSRVMRRENIGRTRAAPLFRSTRAGLSARACRRRPAAAQGPPDERPAATGTGR